VITTKIGQMKSGIILLFEDDDLNWQYSIKLSWMEAAGLGHELHEALDSPLWRERDPKSNLQEVRFPKDGEQNG